MLHARLSAARHSALVVGLLDVSLPRAESYAAAEREPVASDADIWGGGCAVQQIRAPS